MITKTMNHAECQKKMRKLDINSLYFIRKDASEAADCAEAMGNESTASYYRDEAIYAGQEIERRKALLKEAI